MAKFKIQPDSSFVNWTGKKVLGLHTGSINISQGYIEIKNEKVIGGEIEIDMTSITITDIADKKTHDEFLAHLQNEDFFAVHEHKTSKLVFTNTTLLAPEKYKIEGMLTIKEITHPVSFTCSIETYTDFLHSLGEIVIDRTLYNIRYGSGKFIPNLGDKLIYDDFILQFKLIGQL